MLRGLVLLAIVVLTLGSATASGADAEIYRHQHGEWHAICLQDEMTDEVSCFIRAVGLSDASNARRGLALSVRQSGEWSFSVKLEDLDGSKPKEGWLRVDYAEAKKFERCERGFCEIEDKFSALFVVEDLSKGRAVRLRLKGAAIIDARISLDGFREALDDLEAVITSRALGEAGRGAASRRE